MSDLPEWNGADVVYARAQKICSVLNASAYAEQRSKDKRKNFKFTPSPESLEIIAAMNVGDEEALKAFCFQYREYWL